MLSVFWLSLLLLVTSLFCVVSVLVESVAIVTSLFCVVSVLVAFVVIGDLTVLCCQCSG